MDPRDGEDRRAQESEPEREEVGRGGVQVVTGQISHGRPKRRDLRERQVDENDAPLDNVHTEVGVDPGQDQARDESRQEDLKDGHAFPFMAVTKASML